MMVWESFYYQKISSLRNLELVGLRKNIIIFLIWVLILWNSPIASLVAMMSAMFGMGLLMNVVQMNVFLKVYFSVASAMSGIPYCLTFGADIMIALRRIDTFLRSDELDLAFIKDRSDTDKNEDVDCIINFKNVELRALRSS